jgi:hypothetical protein
VNFVSIPRQYYPFRSHGFQDRYGFSRSLELPLQAPPSVAPCKTAHTQRTGRWREGKRARLHRRTNVLLHHLLDGIILPKVQPKVQVQVEVDHNTSTMAVFQASLR